MNARKEGEILRFAQNDKIKIFFGNL